MLFIGIDPGASGGIAALGDTGVVRAISNRPETCRDLLDFLVKISEGQDAHAMLEKAVPFSRPRPGHGMIGTSTAFKIGIGYGELRAMLTAARIPFDEVAPQTWQKEMNSKTGGDKNVSKRRAQELFPGQHVTHATADALLISEYCRRVVGARGPKGLL